MAAKLVDPLEAFLAKCNPPRGICVVCRLPPKIIDACRIIVEERGYSPNKAAQFAREQGHERISGALVKRHLEKCCAKKL